MLDGLRSLKRLASSLMAPRNRVMARSYFPVQKTPGAAREEPTHTQLQELCVDDDDAHAFVHRLITLVPLQLEHLSLGVSDAAERASRKQRARPELKVKALCDDRQQETGLPTALRFDLSSLSSSSSSSWSSSSRPSSSSSASTYMSPARVDFVPLDVVLRRSPQSLAVDGSEAPVVPDVKGFVQRRRPVQVVDFLFQVFQR